MAQQALVSGSDERVGQVAEALRAAGAEVVVSDVPSMLAEVLAGSAPGSLDCYVQLPVNVDVSGATVVGRVRMFLQKGLLARFDAVDLVMPALRDDAVVVLVSGNTAVQTDVMPDDSAARFALVNVLAHAIRAQGSPGKVRVRLLDSGSDPADIASVALRGEVVAPARLSQVKAREAELSYEDWRAEVMGLATMEV